MTSINSVTELDVEGDIAVLTLNSPPVNALSADVRDGLALGVAQAAANPTVRALVIICAGKTFIAGADIAAFGKPPKGTSTLETLRSIEAARMPVIAAIHGTALGGGVVQVGVTRLPLALRDRISHALHAARALGDDGCELECLHRAVRLRERAAVGA